MIAVAGAAALGGGHGPEYAAINLPFSSNPWTTKLNVSISRVSYITEPSQWIFSAANHTVKPKYTDSTAWVTNNSGYQFAIWNSTTSTAPSPAVFNFTVGSSLGSTVSYIFTDTRAAVNGTGATSYIEVSESGQSAAPTGSALNSPNSAATAKQNIIFVQLTEHNATTYVPTVGYYASNSKGYQNYTTYSFAENISSLQMYDFLFNIQKTYAVVSIMNGTGAIVDTSGNLYPVLSGNLSKVEYLTDILAPAASTAGDMMILDYSYLVDNSPIVYAPSVAVAGVASSFASTIAPFDPGTARSNFTQNANASNSYSSTTVASSDFPTIVNSSSNATKTSSLISPSLLPSANQTQVLSSQALAKPRTTSALPGSVSTTLYLTSWTRAGINESIRSFLQGYIGGKINVPADDVQIVSYLIDYEGFDINFSASTMSQVGDYIYNAVPGILQSNHLSLVNTQTSAIVAGAAIGNFWSLGGPIAPAVVNGMIENPLTGTIYGSPMAAGFPAGSYIMGGSIVVPGQAVFYGFAADGLPIFSASFNPFGALSGAASSVASFFQSAGSTVANSATTVAQSANSGLYAIKQVTGSAVGSDLNNFATQTEQAVNSVMPFMGGALGQVSTDVSGTLSHSLSGVGNGLASFRSSAAGAIAAGVSHINQGILSLGTTMSHVGTNITRGVYSTAGTFTKDANAVISPLVTTVKNLPGDINATAYKIGSTSLAVGESLWSAADKLGSEIQTGGQNALNAIGNSFSKLANGSYNWMVNPFGAIANALTSPFSFMGTMATSVAHILEIVAVAGAAIVIVIVAVWYFTHDGKRRKSRGTRRRA